MSNFIIKCPFCDKKYSTSNPDKRSECKHALYDHMSNKHLNELNGKSPAQVYFNYKYKKEYGTCVMCHKPTKWSESTEHYERFCSEKCKEAYRKQFQERMMRKYGKTCLLDDPEQQKKMLANRKISGEYLWSDKKSKKTYTGSYERDFLEFVDLVLNLNASDVIAPAPQVFSYKLPNEKKTRFYIPDFYITSLNLIVEIKDGGSNPNTHPKIQAVDKLKEKAKDEIMSKQKDYNYIKITDKDYSILLNYLLERKNKG